MAEGWRLASLLTGLLLMAGAAAELRDPLRPPQQFITGDPAAAPEADSGAPAPLRLQSTLVGGTRALAIINGTRVHAGERVAGATVLRIAPGRVDLRRDGTVLTLRLFPPQTRTARAPPGGRGPER